MLGGAVGTLPVAAAPVAGDALSWAVIGEGELPCTTAPLLRACASVALGRVAQTAPVVARVSTASISRVCTTGVTARTASTPPPAVCPPYRRAA